MILKILSIFAIMAGTAFGATALETQFATNTISMFGGLEWLVGIIALGIFVVAAGLTRIPIIILSPIYALSFMFVAANFPEFRFIGAIITGFAIGAFIYSMWRGR